MAPTHQTDASGEDVVPTFPAQATNDEEVSLADFQQGPYSLHIRRFSSCPHPAELESPRVQADGRNDLPVLHGGPYEFRHNPALSGNAVCASSVPDSQLRATEAD